MAQQTCDQKSEKASFTGLVIKPIWATLVQTVRDTFGGRPNTVLYPKERLVLPDRYRGKHVLSFTRCIGCSQCVDICPNECMFMKKIDDPVLGKIERPGVDYARCLFCGLCVDICPTDAILETAEYELSSYDREGMRYQPEDIRNDNFQVKEPKPSIMLPSLDLDKCKGRGECAKVCPVKCITMAEVEKAGKKKPEIDLAACTSCGKCAEACPEKALEMKGRLVVMFERPLPKFTLASCTGCSLCMKGCPADAIYMMEMPGTEKKKADGTMGKPKKRSVFVLEKCVGCSRCARACKFKSIEMVPESKYKGGAGR
jgi:NADH-quinone oxidoreductase chain I